MKKILYYIVSFITFLVISVPKTAFAMDSYTDNCNNNISNEIVSYNNIGMSSNKSLVMPFSGNIIYNIKNVKYVTITTFSTDSTSIFSCNNKLYLTPYQGGNNVSLEDAFVFLSGNQKHAVDNAGNIYKYIVDDTVMFPKLYFFKKIDVSIPIEKYYGINIYSINSKGEKTPLKLIKNKTSYITPPNSIRQYTCQKTFYVSGSNDKIYIEYDLGMNRSNCEIHQISFQGENLVVGNKPEKPEIPDKPEKPDEPGNKPDDPSKPSNNGSSGGSSSRPSRPDWEYVDDDYIGIYNPSISDDNLLQDSNHNSNDKLNGSMIDKDNKNNKESSSSNTKDKSKPKKETVKKEKKETSKKEKEENSESEIIINYEADTPLSSSSDKKLEKIIAIISICSASIVIIKTAGTGFSKIKK